MDVAPDDWIRLTAERFETFHAGFWKGKVLFVDEVHDWGLVATYADEKGEYPIRVEHGDYEKVDKGE